MIMLISFDVLLSILLIESELFKQIQYVLVYGDVRNPRALLKNVLRNEGETEPGVFSDVLSFVSLLWVCVEDTLHEISTAITYKFGNEEVSAENLFVKFGCVGVFEGKVAADKSKEDDAC